MIWISDNGSKKNYSFFFKKERLEKNYSNNPKSKPFLVQPGLKANGL